MANVIVLFEVTLKEGRMEEYLEMAASLKEELLKAEGFIRAERFSSLSEKNKLLSKSEWRDEESIAKWRNQLKHRLCRRKGRAGSFADYKITVVAPLRCYTMMEREEAPAAANYGEE